MECEILRTLQEFESIKNDWERLENIAPNVPYFSTYRLNHDWWLSYDDDTSLELFIITVAHQGHIVGIAPLQIKSSKEYSVNVKTLQFIRTGNDYSNFLIGVLDNINPVSVVRTILSQIEAHKYEFDKIDLKHISQHTVLAHTILDSKYLGHFKYQSECVFIDFSKYSSFEDYAKCYKPRGMKTDFNKFCREVDFRLEVTSENTVDEIGKIHKAEKEYLHSKGFIQRHSYFENKRELSFKQRLYTDNDHVMTYLLINNGNDEIICFLTGYVKNEILHAVTTAYNPKYVHYSVGKFFYFMIFQQNFEVPKWRILDLGTGRYSWKFEMTDSFNIIYQLNIECIRDKKARFIHKWRRLLSVLWNGARV